MAGIEDAGYSGMMPQDADEALFFQKARELIAQHGDHVAAFLQAQIDEAMDSGDFEQLSNWYVIRNAVALSLNSSTSSQ